MIGFSPVRPHLPAAAPVKFGYFPGMGAMTSSSSSAEFTEAELRETSWAGFTPGSIRSLLNTDKSPAVTVIDNDKALDFIWRKLNLPDYDKPRLNFRNQTILLVAREQGTNASSGIPVKATFNFTDNKLTVNLPKNEPGTPGVAWYVGVLQADKGTSDKPKELLAKPDTHRLSHDTTVTTYCNS